MNKTRYFRNYERFRKFIALTGETCNGTDQIYMSGIETANERCWQCERCTNCVNCANCTGCYNCTNCTMCHECTNCDNCCYSYHCQDCEDVTFSGFVMFAEGVTSRYFEGEVPYNPHHGGLF